MARRGVVKIDKVTMADGTTYHISLDKNTGEFISEDPESKGILKRKELASLKGEIIKKHLELQEGEYVLKIRISGCGNDGGHRESFQLDRFDFEPVFVREKEGGTTLYAGAKFREPDCDISRYMSEAFSWKRHPQGPDDEIIQDGGPSRWNRGGKWIDYSWEKWCALEDIRKKIALLRERLTEIFNQKDLEKLLEAGPNVPLIEARPKPVRKKRRK